MRSNVILLAALLAATPAMAADKPGSSAEGSRSGEQPPKSPKKVEEPKKDPPKEAAPAKPNKKKTDPRGMEVEPVDFKAPPPQSKPH